MKKLILILATLFVVSSISYSYDVNAKINIPTDRDTDLGTVFNKMQVATQNQIQFYFDVDVKLNRKISFNLNDIKFGDALKLILTLNNLDYRELSSSLYFIYPTEKAKEYSNTEIKTFIISNQNINNVIKSIKALYPDGVTIDSNADINTITVRAKKEVLNDIANIVSQSENLYEKNREEENMSKSKIEKFYYLNFYDAKEMANLLIQYYPIDKQFVDVNSNSIYLLYNSMYQEKIENAIKKLDVAIPQIRAEVTVIDQINENTSNIGIKWQDNTATSLDKLKNYDIKYMLLPKSFDFTQILSNSKILANPSIVITNKKEAKILVGEQIPIVTSKQTSNSSETLVPQVEYKDVGIILKTTPVIHSDTGEVTLNISLDVNSLGDAVPSNFGTYYRIKTKSIITTLTLKNGEQVLFGGLMSKEERTKSTSVPVLGSIPWVGRLFQSKEKTPVNSEVMLLIKPIIMDSTLNNDVKIN